MKTNQKKNFMTKALQFLSLVADNVELASYQAADGTVIDVAEDGSTSAADGEYVLDSGDTLVVKDGIAKISETVKEDQEEDKAQSRRSVWSRRSGGEEVVVFRDVKCRGSE